MYIGEDKRGTGKVPLVNRCAAFPVSARSLSSGLQRTNRIRPDRCW